jgi:hypothetical protein
MRWIKDYVTDLVGSLVEIWMELLIAAGYFGSTQKAIHCG